MTPQHEFWGPAVFLFDCLVPSSIGGLVWFGFARVLCFLWVHREIRNIFKWLSHLNQLCECWVHRHMSGGITYPGFKIWQVIQVNSGFYLLNHIKVPKQMYLEFWTHNLSEAIVIKVPTQVTRVFHLALPKTSYMILKSFISEPHDSLHIIEKHWIRSLTLNQWS